MGVYKITGIVIREFQKGEANKQIIVLTKERGRLTLSARGAKNTKSKLLAAAQLFCCCDFIVFDGKYFLSISEATVLESYFELRQDPVKLSYAAYMAQVLERTVLPEMECGEIVELFLSALCVISKSDFSPKLATCIFELKYLELSGLMAEAEHCYSCGKPLYERETYFCFQTGEFLCASCGRIRPYGRHMLPGTLNAIQFVFTMKPRKAFSFRVSSEVLKELIQITEGLMNFHIDEVFPALAYAKKMEEEFSAAREMI